MFKLKMIKKPILFKNNTIGGTYITNNYWNESLKQEVLDV